MTRFKLYLPLHALALSLIALPADATTPRSSSAKTAFKSMQRCPATGLQRAVVQATLLTMSFLSPVAAPMLPKTCNGRPRMKRRKKTAGHARAAVADLLNQLLAVSCLNVLELFPDRIQGTPYCFWRAAHSRPVVETPGLEKLLCPNDSEL